MVTDVRLTMRRTFDFGDLYPLLGNDPKHRLGRPTGGHRYEDEIYRWTLDEVSTPAPSIYQYTDLRPVTLHSMVHPGRSLEGIPCHTEGRNGKEEAGKGQDRPYTFGGRTWHSNSSVYPPDGTIGRTREGTLPLKRTNSVTIKPRGRWDSVWIKINYIQG